MHILLIGAQGLLGAEIRNVLQAWDGCDLTCWSRNDYDITLPSVSDAVCALTPDIVINAAAWTDVDGAEAAVEAAYAVNMLGPKFLAEGCKQSGARLIHISTNEVFAGESGQVYREYDCAGPKSVYACSKYAGEQAIMAIGGQYAIVRTAWLYSSHPNCFPFKILAAAKKHGALRVVDDEFGNPTFAPDVADAIQKLIATERCDGIFHLVNSGSASRYTWTQYLLELLDMADVPLTPVGSDEWPRAARPPRHAVLENLTASALSVRLRPWQEAMRYFRQEMM